MALLPSWICSVKLYTIVLKICNTTSYCYTLYYTLRCLPEQLLVPQQLHSSMSNLKHIKIYLNLLPLLTAHLETTLSSNTRYWQSTAWLSVGQFRNRTIQDENNVRATHLVIETRFDPSYLLRWTAPNHFVLWTDSILFRYESPPLMHRTDRNLGPIYIAIFSIGSQRKKFAIWKFQSVENNFYLKCVLFQFAM